MKELNVKLLKEGNQKMRALYSVQILFRAYTTLIEQTLIRAYTSKYLYELYILYKYRVQKVALEWFYVRA